MQIDFAEVYERIVAHDTIYQRLAGEVELRRGELFIYCDEATIRNDDYVRARGNVVLLQNDTLSLFADSMHYYASQDLAMLYGQVVLVNGEQKLFTDVLRYDIAAKRATYATRAKLTDGQAQLSSLRGVYDLGIKRATFRDSVFVVGENFNLISDTLSFATDRRIVYFEGPTVMATTSSRVYCEDGYYDMRDSIGEFRRNAQVAREDARYRADLITFNAATNEFQLIGAARFADAERRARGDTIRYHERTNRTQIIGSADYVEGDQHVSGQRIDYNGITKTFSSQGRVAISEPPYLLDADSVDFTDETGLAFVNGNVIWRDTASQRTLTADHLVYRQDDEYIKAFGGRPLFTAVVEEDTTYISADTLLSFRQKYSPPLPAADTNAASAGATVDSVSAQVPLLGDSVQVDSLRDVVLPRDTSITVQLSPKPASAPVDSARSNSPAAASREVSPDSRLQPLPLDTTDVITPADTAAPAAAAPDSIRLVLAYNNVRIYKSDLQAVCDSLAMNSLDSTITLFRDPLVWSDTSQFTADTVVIKLRGQDIDNVKLLSKSMIVNSTDERFFNQIKGRRIDVAFSEGEIHRMLVRGNAESVYYILDEQQAYIGVNHVRSARMRIDFAAGKLTDIRFYDQPQGGIEPMAASGQAPKVLEDFRWEIQLRPRSKDDLQ